jgi:hypothetical protein
MTNPQVDALVERLEMLLDQATVSVRADDADTAILLLMELIATAQQLPQKPAEAAPPLPVVR